MKLTLALLPFLFIASPSLSQPQSSTADSTATTISGKVVDSKGVPVVGAHVCMRGFNWVGLVPGAVTTSDGSFRITAQPFGNGVISAYKLDVGFPDAEMALYGRWAYPSVAQIDALPEANIQVTLRFSEPDAMVEWTVLSKADQTPLARAAYRIEWSDDPKIFISASIHDDGLFRFVLPKHPVIIRIQAPGFRDWVSTDPRAFDGPLLLKPGSTDRRVILLDPE